MHYYKIIITVALLMNITKDCDKVIDTIIMTTLVIDMKKKLTIVIIAILKII